MIRTVLMTGVCRCVRVQVEPFHRRLDKC